MLDITFEPAEYPGRPFPVFVVRDDEGQIVCSGFEFKGALWYEVDGVTKQARDESQLRRFLRR